MNTKSGSKGKRALLAIRKKAVVNNFQTRHVSAHCGIWEIAKARAEELGYKGGVSGYIAGLVLFDKVASRPHWLTVDLVNDAERLQGVLEELAKQPLDQRATWIEHRVSELAAKKSTSSTGTTT